MLEERLAEHDFECCIGIAYTLNNWQERALVYEELKN